MNFNVAEIKCSQSGKSKCLQINCRYPRASRNRQHLMRAFDEEMMTYRFLAMNAEHAMECDRWTYAPPYDFYDLQSPPLGPQRELT